MSGSWRLKSSPIRQKRKELFRTGRSGHKVALLITNNGPGHITVEGGQETKRKLLAGDSWGTLTEQLFIELKTGREAEGTIEIGGAVLKPNNNN